MTRCQSRPPCILMVAGEASGDNLGAGLLSELQTRFPGLESYGVGGTRMQAHGFSTLCDMNELSVIGLIEVVRRLPRLIQRHRQLVALLEQRRPDLLITIDLPDFNFLLARQAQRLAIPRIHYVGPQVWAWRSGRIRKLAALLDHLLVLFPFETGIYAGSGLPVTFVGHPLATQSAPDPTARLRLRQELGLAPDERLLLLLPGSRVSEIRRHLEIMVAASRQVVESHPQVRCVLAMADTLNATLFDEVMATADAQTRTFFARIRMQQGMTGALLAAADVAMVCSGTVTLEAALIGTPMTVLYRVHPLTYAIGRRVIQVAHIALPNLVAGHTLVPERIQQEATPDRLAADVAALLGDGVSAARQQAGFNTIRAQLAQPVHRPAEVVADWLKRLGFADNP
ncbi:MAG: lipid-A-disaccharide synthase [Magnetococcales bacterium]|nr:lipid-A-disaccharide synthase [Magnetococcales bacterium]NGZ06211.1 lipid-A-disaccharide synthase [Magnetococcales bacterium]